MSPPVPAAAKEPNDGLDPTNPARFVKLSFEHLDLRLPDTVGGIAVPGDNSNRFELAFQQPFGRNAVRVTVPLASVDFAGRSGFALGDLELKYTHILSVKKTHGIVLNAELRMDTASRPELGTGKTTVAPGFIYAFFLKGGHIFAPSFSHAFTLGGDSRRADVSTTTMDFYFVPKLKNPKLYITVDPTLILDWERKTQPINLATTFGYRLGPMLGGNGQTYLKPSIGIGGDRLTDWGIEVGVQLLNF